MRAQWTGRRLPPAGTCSSTLHAGMRTRRARLCEWQRHARCLHLSLPALRHDMWACADTKLQTQACTQSWWRRFSLGGNVSPTIQSLAAHGAAEWQPRCAACRCHSPWIHACMHGRQSSIPKMHACRVREGKCTTTLNATFSRCMVRCRCTTARGEYAFFRWKAFRAAVRSRQQMCAQEVVCSGDRKYPV